METIQAKVFVNTLTDIDYGAGKIGEAMLAFPVYGTGEENKSYSEATPSGQIMLTITNKDAFGFFVPQGEYFVIFTPATKGVV